jgi:prepilin-type N-terminal cleavage/methylation domain-containing protein
MSRRAFTLMEMMIVLAIIGLLFAGSYKGISTLNEQAALQKPFEDLRSLAKTAWQRSLTEPRAWQIRFYQSHFTLEPKAAVNEDDRKMFAHADKEKERSSGIKPVEVAPDIVMQIRKWGQKEWVRPEKGTSIPWVFEQSGLCEPISVRFISERRGTVGAQFDPLTAGVKEEITEQD